MKLEKITGAEYLHGDNKYSSSLFNNFVRNPPTSFLVTQQAYPTESTPSASHPSLLDHRVGADYVSQCQLITRSEGNFSQSLSQKGANICHYSHGKIVLILNFHVKMSFHF